MNLLNRLTIKNLKLNKKKSIVTVIGIILSVALITAVSTMYSSVIDTVIGFEKKEKGDFHAAFYKVPVDQIETIKNNTKIQNVAILENIGYAKLKDSKNEYKPYAYIKGYTKDSMKRLCVNLIEGRLPKNENEIVIPTHLKTNGRVELKVGDKITLDVGKRISDGYELDQSNPFTSREKEDIVNTKKTEYTIVGISERPASNVEEYEAPGYTFITYLDENKISKDTVDIYVQYNKEGVKNNEEVTANILGVNKDSFRKLVNNDLKNDEEMNKIVNEMSKAKYLYTLNSYLIILETNPLKNGPIAGLGTVATIVCGIIIVTSVFCIKNSFDISITEKIRQYGMLRSIGATKKQIKKNVFFEATILGTIGIPLGIVFGLLASFVLIILSNYLLADMINISPGNYELILSISWIVILISTLLGMITIYLSALTSAIRASKVSPIESIRNSGNIKIKSKKLRCPKIITALFHEGGVISYKNVKRNKKKYRTTIISIIVSVSVFIALSSFMNLAFSVLESEIKFSGYDLKLNLNNNDLKKSYDMALKTVKLDNIQDYTISKTKNTKLRNPKYNENYKEYAKEMYVDYEEEFLNGDFAIASIGDHQFAKYVKELGLNIDEVNDSGILINSNIITTVENNKTVKKRFDYFEYKKDDIVTLDIDEEGKNKTVDIKIGYITDKVPFGLLEIILSDRSLLIVSDKKYDELTNFSNSGVRVRYKSNNPNKLQDDIEKIVQKSEFSIDNVAEYAAMQRNFYTLLAVFLYGFITVISLIGITNIFNTITTSMELRKREFATLKSIGMTTKEFNNMIRLESVFIGAKSLIFGIPIGVILSYIIYSNLVEDTGIKYEFPVLAVIMAILVVFILISLIMKYSITKINKQNTIETIRNENI